MTPSTHVQFRVSLEQKQQLEDAAKRAGKSLSDYLRDRALSDDTSVPVAALKPDTRRFAQSAPKADVARDTLSEQDVRERIRLRELRQSAPSRPFKGPDLKDKWKGNQ